MLVVFVGGLGCAHAPRQPVALSGHCALIPPATTSSAITSTCAGVAARLPTDDSRLRKFLRRTPVYFDSAVSEAELTAALRLLDELLHQVEAGQPPLPPKDDPYSRLTVSYWTRANPLVIADHRGRLSLDFTLRWDFGVTASRDADGRIVASTWIH